MIDIVIAVYANNQTSFSILKDCLSSVKKHTQGEFRLVLINDQSPFQEVKAYLDDFKKNWPEVNIEILTNEQNLGFVGTANRGFLFSTENDVIILNMDTIVTARWIEKLHQCAYSRPRIGTVTPTSNNATIFSLPHNDQYNSLPNGMSVDDMGQLVDLLSERRYPEVPTAHGFCMFVRRELIATIGIFDGVNFGRGYGEENDYACRARESGFLNILDDSTYIFHVGEASFQGERAKVVEERIKRLSELHPYIMADLGRYNENNQLDYIRRPLLKAIEDFSLNRSDCQKSPRIRILCIGSEGGTYNGLKRYAADLVEALRLQFEFYFLNSHDDGIHLLNEHGEVVDTLGRELKIQWHTSLIHKEYAQLIEYIVSNYKIELIQINHFVGHSLEIPMIAKRLKLPCIYVIHDFELICPSKFLIDKSNQYCGSCAIGDERPNCLQTNPFGPAGLATETTLFAFRRYVSDVVLPNIDKIIGPSKFAANFFQKYYNLDKHKILQIPHLTHRRHYSSNNSLATKKGDRKRVAFIGALHAIKGSLQAEELLANPLMSSIEFHHFGPDVFRAKALRSHGPYHFEDLPRILREEKIDCICLLSVVPETYSYTLTEAKFAQIPVVAFDIGALGQRIREEHLGSVVPPFDVGLLAQNILTQLHSSAASHVVGSSPIDSRQMYAEMYSSFPRILHSPNNKPDEKMIFYRNRSEFVRRRQNDLFGESQKEYRSLQNSRVQRTANYLRRNRMSLFMMRCLSVAAGMAKGANRS